MLVKLRGALQVIGEYFVALLGFILKVDILMDEMIFHFRPLSLDIFGYKC
jgi:hypothetical protein